MASSICLQLFLLAFLSISPSLAISLVGTTASSSKSGVVGSSNSTARAATTITDFVSAHNAARRAVGVPPLVWDPLLARFARVYANQRRHDCQLVHSPGYAFGENIFWGQGRRWQVADVVAAWVAERRWYDRDRNTCSGPECTHYTQIVWRTTARLGCSKIVCDGGDTFVACEYYPPGNYVGARPY